jgi:hypothetical protein
MKGAKIRIFQRRALHYTIIDFKCLEVSTPSLFYSFLKNKLRFRAEIFEYLTFRGEFLLITNTVHGLGYVAGIVNSVGT